MAYKNFNPQGIEMPKSYFIENLRHFRTSNKLSIPELADLLGMHKNTLSKIAHGGAQPSLAVLTLISVMSGYSIDDFCFARIDFKNNTVKRKDR